LATAYYWRIQLIEPDDPDDERYVLLHGEEGEVVGPMTVALAQAWIDRSSRRPADPPPDINGGHDRPAGEPR
jgi:hypothetical protein